MKVVLSQLFDTHISLNEVLDLLYLLRVRLLGQLARQLLALVRPDRVHELVTVPKELKGEKARKLGVSFILIQKRRSIKVTMVVRDKV